MISYLSLVSVVPLVFRVTLVYFLLWVHCQRRAPLDECQSPQMLSKVLLLILPLGDGFRDGFEVVPPDSRLGQDGHFRLLLNLYGSAELERDHVSHLSLQDRLHGLGDLFLDLKIQSSYKNPAPSKNSVKFNKKRY